MKNIDKHIKLIAAAALFWCGAAVTLGYGAEAYGRDEIEAYGINLVNQIRKDPVAYAAQLGYSPDTFLAERPWIADVINDGMPQISGDSYLRRQAILENDLEAGDADSHRTLWQAPAVSGTVSGTLSFFNFVTREAAVKVMVDHQFKSELEGGYQGRRLLFSSEMDRVGVAVGSGTAGVDSTPFYNVSLVLGSSVSKARVQLLNMVNQLRADPARTLQMLSVTGHAVPAAVPPLMGALSLGVLAGEIIDQSDADTAGYDAASIYAGHAVDFLRSINTFPKAGDDLELIWAFSSLMLADLRQAPWERVILNGEFNQAGFAYYFVSGEQYDFVKLTAAAGVQGAVENNAVSNVYGIVYSDPDDNGFYTPGEGVADTKVSVFEKSTRIKISSVLTNNAGQFSFSLPAGCDYILLAGTPEKWTGRDFSLAGSNAYVDMILK